MNVRRNSRKSTLSWDQRIKILQTVERLNGDHRAAALELKCTPQLVARTITWNHHRTNKPFRAKHIAGRQESLTIRQRLYEQLVRTTEEANRPILEIMREFIFSDLMPKVAPDAGPKERESVFNDARELLGIFMSAFAKQADRAIKMLYGMPEALASQGETKHSGTVEHDHRLAIISKLAKRRDRLALEGQVQPEPKIIDITNS